MKTIPYGRQWIDKDDISAVVRTLRSDWLTQGPAVQIFEEALCKQTGAKYAVAVANGTAALHLACLAANIKNGSEVITSALTFAASANCVRYCGAKVVFADIDQESGCVDPAQIEKLISKKTKMLIPVHYAGHSCDMEKIQKIARAHQLVVLEDAAHALGATYKKTKVGSCRYSDMAIFSFHPVKHVTTGEGGAIITNNIKLYQRLLLLRTHGISKNNLKRASEGAWYYEMQELGFNYRITDFQAALGTSQLKKLKGFVKRRREIVEQYNAAFGQNEKLIIPTERAYTSSSYHLYPLRLKEARKRSKVFASLREKGILVQVHYIPVYYHPYYRKLGYKKGLCPNAEAYYAREISLPLFPALKEKDVKRVIATVLSVI